MSKYILIHGAWHGAWCWDKVVPLLKLKGHNVEAIDLPGSGKDKTPISRLNCFSSFVLRRIPNVRGRKMVEILNE